MSCRGFSRPRKMVIRLLLLGIKPLKRTLDFSSSLEGMSLSPVFWRQCLYADASPVIPSLQLSPMRKCRPGYVE